MTYACSPLPSFLIVSAHIFQGQSLRVLEQPGASWCATTAECRPQSAECRVQSADRRLQTAKIWPKTDDTSWTIGNLSKHDGDSWRERHKTKGLVSKTMTLHVRYRFWYISCHPLQNNNVKWPNPKFYVERELHDSEFSFFDLNCNAVLTESAPGLFGYSRKIERVLTIAKKFKLFGSHFCCDVFLALPSNN